MNESMSKKIRKAVYGDHVSGPKGRKYSISYGRMIIADPVRRMYQKIKRDYTRKVEYAEDKKQAENKDQGGNSRTNASLAS